MNAKWHFGLLSSMMLLLLIALALASHGTTVKAQATQPATMAPAPVAPVVQAWVDAWNSHKAEAFDTVFTKDGVYDDEPSGTLSKGLTEIHTFAGFFTTAVPDLHIELVSSWVQDGHGVMQWIYSGTDVGVYKTGKKFSIRGASIFDTDGSLMSRDVDYYDLAAMMRQVGLLPAGL